MTSPRESPLRVLRGFSQRPPRLNIADPVAADIALIGKLRTQNPNASIRYVVLIRWLKFNFVGAIGVVVQFSALFLMKGLFHLNYLASTAVAVEAAVVHNFVWHEQFTWSDRVTSDGVPRSLRRSLARFARFNLSTGAVSIVGNLALMRLMVGEAHLNYLLANAIAIALCSIANFLVSDVWVFRGLRI